MLTAMDRVLVVATAVSLVASSSRGAHAQTVAPPAAGADEAPQPAGSGAADTSSKPLADLEKAPPPPTNVVYFQYGVSFTAEVVTSPGPICDNVTVPCILGPGGGIAARAGWRGTGALYLGGAYEFSKQDPNKLYRLAILQQLRGEARYYFVSGRDAEPYISGGLGIAGYGNEWAVDTWGPAGFFGVGVEAQITRRTVVGVGLGYRLLYFQRFTDTTGAPRDSGIAQLIGLDFVLEQREPIFTEGRAPTRAGR